MYWLLEGLSAIENLSKFTVGVDTFPIIIPAGMEVAVGPQQNIASLTW